ncbi:MAG: hypothetical protein LC790_03905, partial [Actinobacteria bacterium]|nr:hypothetical protein [Actinomycetota bacterium]
MASIIALVWLLAMLGLFGWLLCWDRSERRDHRPGAPKTARARGYRRCGPPSGRASATTAAPPSRAIAA